MCYDAKSPGQMPSSTVYKLLPFPLQPRRILERPPRTHLGLFFSRTSSPSPRKVRRPYTLSIGNTPSRPWRTHQSTRLSAGGESTTNDPYVCHKKADGRVHPPQIGGQSGFFLGINRCPSVLTPSVRLSQASEWPTPVDAGCADIDVDV